MIIFIFLTCINNFSIFAANIDENDLGKYRIYCNRDSEHYIKYNNITQINYEYYYLNKNNERIPAYCLNLGVDGPETTDEYYVNVGQALEDNVVTSILLNGYPYKTPYELGLESDVQAAYCTQFAIWIYLSNLDLNKISATKNEYENVVSAIKSIYHNGIQNNSNTNSLIQMQIGKPEVYDKTPDLYSIRIKLDYNEDNIYGYNLNIEGLKNYSLLDNDTHMQIYPDAVYGYKDFRILIPREDIKENVNVSINLNYEARNACLMFGVADINGMQNLVLTKDMRVNRSIKQDIKIEYVKNNFVIKKIDKDDETKTISGVKFRLYNENMELLGEYITDENGIISFDYLKELNLKGGDKIILEEVEAPNDYYIDKDNNKVELIIKYDYMNEVIIKNEKSFGNIKILKKSFDYNPYNNINENTPLKDCEFEIYDKNMNFVEKIITDKNGVAKSKNLELGKYYIKEIKTNQYYILDSKLYEIELKNHNFTKEISLFNKSMKKELPKTGF